MSINKINLLNFDKRQMEAFVSQLGEKSFRATQMIKWIHQKGETDFDKMTNLSKPLRDKLKVIADIRLPQVFQHQASKDGTHKWLFQLHDGNCIETVFIPENGRGTLCISSQVGCALNCSFCATGAQGFNRNLSASEIIGQLWQVNRRLEIDSTSSEKKVTNIVMMGMGEPLLNFDHVLASLNLMLDDNAYGLSKYRVTVSTSGIIPEMLKLKEETEAALALSLHAPNDSLRNILVPINKKYPIADLMEVCKNYYRDKRRHITIEYVMLAEVNDTPQHARQLVKVLEGVPVKLNLIPFNPSQFARYERSSEETIKIFSNIVSKAGITTIVRRTRGDDIDAACGQLAGNFKDKTKRRLRHIKKYENSQIVV